MIFVRGRSKRILVLYVFDESAVANDAFQLEDRFIEDVGCDAGNRAHG